MKVLVAGGGAFGREHLRTLAALEVECAVADLRPEALAALRAEFALADVDTDMLSLVKRFRPDGIVVATPAASHEALATEALRQGIPVLVEKPLADATQAAERLCEAAKRSSAFLQPGHILRFSAGHQALLGILKRGEIGKLLRFSSRRYRDSSHAGRYPDVDPVLMTLIHDIDLALWFDGGPPRKVEAHRRPPGQADSLTTVFVQSASGAEWLLSTAWLHSGPHCPPDRVEIIGTSGSAELEVGSHIDLFGAEPRRVGLGDDDPLITELRCFLEGVRDGRSHSPVSPEEALSGLRLAEAIVAEIGRR
ncbi:MAG: Gfo/Idh/MocA family oxidoreductase [Rhizobiaceae bacterium]|nr:Gfo/Idh/MocA family oxidoreductase [Rhizobiaceae bacterium]